MACPLQLSEESIAAFPFELPALDETRMSPSVAACAATVRNSFTSASSQAQNLMRTMRDAWMQWRIFPTISEGIWLLSFVQ